MKLKTSKSALKRFKFSATGKLLRRRVAVNHFNAKDSGSDRRQRRATRPLAKSNRKDIRNLMPYNASTIFQA